MRHSLELIALRPAKGVARLVDAIVLVSALACTPALAEAGSTEPTSSTVYDYIDELRLHLRSYEIFHLTGPGDRGDLESWLNRVARPCREASPRARWLAAMLTEELRPESASRTAGSPVWWYDATVGVLARRGERIKPQGLVRLACYLPDGVSIWTSLRSSINHPEAHKTHTQVWRGRGRASFDCGGIEVRHGALSVFTGRDEVSWGPSRSEGLLISGSAPSLDMVKLSLRSGPVLFTSFHSKLRTDTCESYWRHYERFLAGHRLEVLASSRLLLGISEVVLYAGYGRGFEPAYLNPFAVLYAGQWNSERSDNILIAGDFSVLLPGRAEVRGEVMVDDFQYEESDAPNKAGFAVEARARSPFRPGDSVVGLSYLLITKQTYGHVLPWNAYVHEGELIGYPGGCDTDRVGAWLTVAPRDGLVVKAAFTAERRGKTGVACRAGSPVLIGGFPTGTVETRRAVGVEVTWRPVYGWLLAGTADWIMRHNADNVEGKRSDELGLSLSISYRFKPSVHAGRIEPRE